MCRYVVLYRVGSLSCPRGISFKLARLFLPIKARLLSFVFLSLTFPSARSFLPSFVVTVCDVVGGPQISLNKRLQDLLHDVLGGHIGAGKGKL